MLVGREIPSMFPAETGYKICSEGATRCVENLKSATLDAVTSGQGHILGEIISLRWWRLETSWLVFKFGVYAQIVFPVTDIACPNN